MKRNRLSACRYACATNVIVALSFIVARVNTALALGTTDDQFTTYQYRPNKFLDSFEALRREQTASFDGAADAGGAGNCTGDSRSGGKIVVAAVQLSSSSPPGSTEERVSSDAKAFLDRAISAVESAVSDHNATLVLLQELFLGPYFCQSQDANFFGLAEDLENSIFLRMMQALARRLNVVLPVSLFERRNNAFYNSVVMIDADGQNLGTYRKSHIPDGTGYQEKFYFTPGDTGFKVFNTKVGNLGVGICWDQWFPEAARSMALSGADLLLFPTAIGTEPQDPTLDSSGHWQRVMQGHAAANMVPVVASNRVGTEILLHPDGSEKQRITFYGRSFITDETGAIVQEAKEGPSDIIVSEIDTEKNKAARVSWGLFRDRRPELYGALRTKDGHAVMP